ncbi:MAG: AlpA family phage regulatory protein [Synergistaceae bacterium]|nr:AlpA family phage regulatory protein [Synergistaceae bacterium]
MKTFGIGRSTLLGLIKRGAFPKGIRLGRILRWSVSDIQAWIDSQNGANA